MLSNAKDKGITYKNALKDPACASSYKLGKDKLSAPTEPACSYCFLVKYFLSAKKKNWNDFLGITYLKKLLCPEYFARSIKSTHQIELGALAIIGLFTLRVMRWFIW